MHRADTRNPRLSRVQARPGHGAHGSRCAGERVVPGPVRVRGGHAEDLRSGYRARGPDRGAGGHAHAAARGPSGRIVRLDAEDAEWYRTEYRRLGEEITALKALPERKPGMRLVPTGRTIAQEWDAADNARRREMLAEFEVRVVLHPTGHDPRVAITGMEISPDGFELAG